MEPFSPPRCAHGKIRESVVDEAVRRVLRVKFALGLFEHPYTVEVPLTKPRRSVARQRARWPDETFVLLKNEPVEGVGTLLPLTAKAKKVALIGPLADNQREMLGAWAVAGNPKLVVTLKTALTERLGDRLLYAAGLRSALWRRRERCSSASASAARLPQDDTPARSG